MEQVISFDFWQLEYNEDFCKMATIVLEKCFEVENITNSKIGINIIFTIPEEIRKINQKYRNIDKATDVLSFPMFEKDEIDAIKDTEVPEVLGDIVLSIEQIEKQAVEYEHSFEREFSYMIVHGFYHLIGYDHIIEADKKVMREKEEYVLNKIIL